MTKTNSSSGETLASRRDAWPTLPPLEAWTDTLDTVHRWSQIVGKIRLASTPWINHSWHVPLYVSSNGLTTSPIYDGGRAFEIAFDFINHRLAICTSSGGTRTFSLEPMSVADFYAKLMRALADLDVEVRIWPMPVEIPGPVEAFPDDRRHTSYEPASVTLFWRALVQANRVLTDFRAGFIGKVSPVHFFWGAFDLAVTRFSGRRAPTHPGGAPNCADWVMQEAYSHEVSSAGFWPGTGLGEAAFYSYAYPEPKGFRERSVQPAAARYAEDLGEFVLPYEAVRASSDPDATLLDFLQRTYEAAADLAEWDRAALERENA